MSNYKTPGTAHFYCPDLWQLMGMKHHTQMSDAEKFEVITNDQGEKVYKYDGQGHSSWTFVWDAGSYHISHPKNGGVPSCAKCGKQMVFVAGDDPGHAPSA